MNRPIDLFAPGEMTRISEGRAAGTEREPFNAKLSGLHDWFLEGSRREARAGARLIVWPEQSLLVFNDDEPAFLERARGLAADERAIPLPRAGGSGDALRGSSPPHDFSKGPHTLIPDRSACHIRRARYAQFSQSSARNPHVSREYRAHAARQRSCNPARPCHTTTRRDVVSM